MTILRDPRALFLMLGTLLGASSTAVPAVFFSLHQHAKLATMTEALLKAEAVARDIASEKNDPSISFKVNATLAPGLRAAITK